MAYSNACSRQPGAAGRYMHNSWPVLGLSRGGRWNHDHRIRHSASPDDDRLADPERASRLAQYTSPRLMAFTVHASSVVQPQPTLTKDRGRVPFQPSRRRPRQLPCVEVLSSCSQPNPSFPRNRVGWRVSAVGVCTELGTCSFRKRQMKLFRDQAPAFNCAVILWLLATDRSRGQS